MCGISFLWDKQGICEDIHIQKMVKAQGHRGPDAQHFYTHQFSSKSKLFLGASRLRITENTEDADQPFYSNDRSYAIIFNGEIYNFFDLKNTLLKQGIQFTTNSDTEVLLHWIRIFGKEGIIKLDGMFSFVFCNFSSNEIIIARDRFGMKPLYYFEDDRYLIIATEARAIIASELVRKELNEHQIAHYFSFKHARSPETFYKNVYQLKAGHFISIVDGMASEPIPYFKPDYSNEQFTVDEIKQDIIDSLYQHIYSKRGVGLMLSGGIDSSLLLALAVKEGIKLPCYSIFQESSSSEKKNAYFLAKELLVDHRVLDIDLNILNDFEEYVSYMDQPIADSAGLLTWHLCQFASNDVKVLLSGAGADELFAGYNRHKAFSFYLKNKEGSLWLKKYGYSIFGNAFPKNLQLFFDGVDANEKVTMTNFIKSHFSILSNQFPTQYLPESPTSDHLKNFLIEDRNNYLQNDVLAISDVMSMSLGMEMRMPYLSNSILEKVNFASSDFLIGNGPKWILKELLSEFVPKNYIHLKKMGFGMPLNSWLANEKSNHLWSLFENQNSIIFKFLEHGIFNQLLSRHKGRKGNHSQELWSILTLGYWLQKEFS